MKFLRKTSPIWRRIILCSCNGDNSTTCQGDNCNLSSTTQSKTSSAKKLSNEIFVPDDSQYLSVVDGVDKIDFYLGNVCC